MVIRASHVAVVRFQVRKGHVAWRWLTKCVIKKCMNTVCKHTAQYIVRYTAFQAENANITDGALRT